MVVPYTHDISPSMQFGSLCSFDAVISTADAISSQIRFQAMFDTPLFLAN